MKILSLGAGVQSTTIALMVARGELPALDAAIFADSVDFGAAPTAEHETGDLFENECEGVCGV